MKKVLLIGDSISMDYGQYLPDFLAKGIHVYGKPDHGEAYRDLDIPLGGSLFYRHILHLKTSFHM